MCPLSIYLRCLSIYLSIRLSIFIYVYTPTHPDNHKFICLCVHVSTSLHIYILTSLYLSIPISLISLAPYLFVSHLSSRTFIRLYLCTSVSLCLHISIPLYLFVSIYLHLCISLPWYFFISTYLYLDILSLPLYLYLYTSITLHICDSVSSYTIYYILYIIYPRVCVPIGLEAYTSTCLQVYSFTSL